MDDVSSRQCDIVWLLHGVWQNFFHVLRKHSRVASGLLRQTRVVGERIGELIQVDFELRDVLQLHVAIQLQTARDAKNADFWTPRNRAVAGAGLVRAGGRRGSPLPPLSLLAIGGGIGRVRTYHYSTRLTDRGPGRPGWAGLWSVEDQWGRVIDVVLQYEVHRKPGPSPTLLGGHKS